METLRFQHSSAFLYLVAVNFEWNTILERVLAGLDRNDGSSSLVFQPRVGYVAPDLMWTYG